MRERGIDHYRIVTVAYDGADLDLPREGHWNSPWSVGDINAGKWPWLRSPEWSKDGVSIKAGTTVREFIKTVSAIGGRCYLAVEGQVSA